MSPLILIATFHDREDHRNDVDARNGIIHTICYLSDYLYFNVILGVRGLAFLPFIDFPVVLHSENLYPTNLRLAHSNRDFYY